METFDAPDPNTACGRRMNTILPTQALEMLNDEFMRGQALAVRQASDFLLR